MIKYIEGDLLEANEYCIAHSVNCRGKFASGVAGAIAKKYSWVKEDYLRKYNDDGWELGDVQRCLAELWTNSDHVANFLYIFNMATQDRYGYDDKQYVSYEALRECLIKVFDFCVKAGIDSLGVPFISCGLAGGEWSYVKQIIEETCPENFTVNVYYLSEQEFQKHMGTLCQDDASSPRNQ